MTQEDKELLLRDLSARLPYGVKGIITYDESNTTFTVEGIDNNVLHLSDAEECYVEDFKPCLRPTSSMTEEEKEELKEIGSEYLEKWENAQDSIDRWRVDAEISCKRSEFYNSHLLDWHGLIPKGLAIAVTEENNPYGR